MDDISKYLDRSVLTALDEQRRLRELISPGTQYASEYLAQHSAPHGLFDPQFRAIETVELALPRLFDAASIITAADIPGLLSTQWREQAALTIAPTPDVLKGLVEDHFRGIEQLTVSSRSLLAATDWEKLTSGIGTSEGTISSLQIAMNQMAVDYSGFVDSLTPRGLLDMGPAMVEIPSAEFFRATDLHFSFSHDASEETPALVTEARTSARSLAVVDIDGSLAELDKDLPVQLRGARIAAGGANPDRCRHVTTSLRELVTKMLHLLAPDEAVEAWSSDPNDFHNGRPKRDARLRYIFRDIDHGGLRQFVTADVKAALCFMQALQNGTHGAPQAFTDEQVEALVARGEGLIHMLLHVGVRH